jgi:alanyl-tRNA synthetase
MSAQDHLPKPPAEPPKTTAELRAAFLAYFEAAGHRVVPSHSLLPPGDPTLLFINAGMVQFKDYFTGAREPAYRTATSTQKCLRVSGKHNDLENVGRTRRHQTLFEMLGNFSFGGDGAYFKHDAIKYAWHFLTTWLKLPTERLVATYFEGDKALGLPVDRDAMNMWLDITGLPEERVLPMPASDNFWAMGDTGPCGPCSEIYWDKYPERGPTEFPDDDRYMEIWNLVFMQYDRHGDGRLIPLPQPCVDTGMGLERIASVVQGVGSNYDTDELRGLIQLIIQRSGQAYYGRFDEEGAPGADAKIEHDVAFRVIADHARATAFLIADGVYPDSEGRGYVLRRLMRRALRFGRKLGLDGLFFHEIVDAVVTGMGEAFPELPGARDVIATVVKQEEERFGKTLASGEKLIDEAFERLVEAGGKTLDGQTAFTLYDRHGFPLDLTELIARERGFAVDLDGFEAEMALQRERGKASWVGADDARLRLAEGLRASGRASRFVGYTELRVEGAEILAILQTDEDGQVRESDTAETGDVVEVLFDVTPLYAEGGGQVGDKGRLDWDGQVDAESGLRAVPGEAHVIDVQKPLDDVFLHKVKVVTGTLLKGARVELRVDRQHRRGVQAHHSATHVLHKALRDVLGDHVKQRGSLVEADRLRFDFSHFQALTDRDTREIERRVNRAVLDNEATDVSVGSMEDAMARGALAFFGDKYGDEVRVVQLGDSVELCGGTHVARTGDIGPFRITREGAVSAGVRRVEAICHTQALEATERDMDVLAELSRSFNAPAADLPARVEAQASALKAVQREVEQLKQKLLSGDSAGESETRTFGALQAVFRHVDGVGGKDLRTLADTERDKILGDGSGSGALCLVSVVRPGEGKPPKVGLLVALTSDLVGTYKAGPIVAKLAPLVGGRGGGRPDMAQAGGSDPSGIDAVKAAFFGVFGQ